MIEIIEIRVPESVAQEFLPIGVGTRLGMVRKLELKTGDNLLGLIAQLDREFRKNGRAFFTSWMAHRKYSNQEVAAARLLHVWAKRTFEPAGEECGMQYDDAGACPECGAGGRQTTSLRLDLRKAPRNADLAETIAGERIVTQRLAECFGDAGLTGYELRPVLHHARYVDDPAELSGMPAGRELLKKAKCAGAPHPTWRFWVWVNRVENRPMLWKRRWRSMKRSTRVQRGGLRLPCRYGTNWLSSLQRLS